MNDWLTGIKFNSKDVEQSGCYDLCVAYDNMGNDSLAVYYAERAQRAGYNVAPDFLTKLKGKKAAQMKK